MKGSLNYHRGPIAASAEGIPACRGPKALQFFTRLAPAFSSVLALLLGAASPTTRAESARPADVFVEFFGVNTHLGYYDTTYCDYEEIVKPRLLELGVRHIRRILTRISDRRLRLLRRKRRCGALPDGQRRF